MSEKLRPEQRKLWRRINLTSFDTGSTVEESVANADNMVAQWEERGAFEAEPVVTSTFNPPYGVAFPGDIVSAESSLRATGIDVQNVIAISPLYQRDGFMLIPFTEEGKRLVDFAGQHTFAEMIGLVRKEAREKDRNADLIALARSAPLVA